MPLSDYLARNPELGAPFDRWMTRQSDQHNAAVVAAYDFSPFRTVADIGGDMLRGVPGGADAYLVKRVLMAWGDEQAARILRNCAGAMPEDGKMLVVEMVLPPGNEPSPAKAFDMLMLLNHTGGRIRTEAEFGDLFAAAGLRLTRVIPTASPNSILEGVPA